MLRAFFCSENWSFIKVLLLRIVLSLCGGFIAGFSWLPRGGRGQGAGLRAGGGGGWRGWRRTASPPPSRHPLSSVAHPPIHPLLSVSSSPSSPVGAQISSPEDPRQTGAAAAAPCCILIKLHLDVGEPACPVMKLLPSVIAAGWPE